MDIKFRARLSAYSKVSSIGSSAEIPVPNAGNSGDVLGVDTTGNYALFPYVSKEDIDKLFTKVEEQSTMTHDHIKE